MGWDEARQVTVVQRVKESADDYRYFPEPDLPILEISREWVEEVRAILPELPDAKRDRFISAFGLSHYDASVLVADQAVAGYFEEAVSAGGDPKQITNYIVGRGVPPDERRGPRPGCHRVDQAHAARAG